MAARSGEIVDTGIFLAAEVDIGIFFGRPFVPPCGTHSINADGHRFVFICVNLCSSSFFCEAKEAGGHFPKAGGHFICSYRK